MAVFILIFLDEMVECTILPGEVRKVERGEYINVREKPADKKPLPQRFVVPKLEIVQYFSSVGSKNGVIDGFLKFSGRCFSNLAVFSVFSRDIQFLKGAGDNIKQPPHLGVYSIDRNTIVRRVVVSKFPYKGAIPVGVEEKAIFSKFFNRYAEEVFIYPGSIEDENTDILFYADGFEEERESSIATFEYIVEKATLSLKLLWVQKKLSTI